MRKKHKKKSSPPKSLPEIHPDSLIHPYLLKGAKRIRRTKSLQLDEKFAVPCTWDKKEIDSIHDGIREWLNEGRFETLANLLKDNPARMVHPVIMLQLDYLANFSRRYEEGDSLDDYIKEHDGPLFQRGTRLAARNTLLKIFQGMWDAFYPNTTLTMKFNKRVGRRHKWQPWEREELLVDFNALNEQLEEFDAELLRRGRNETEERYLRRIVPIVRQLNLTSEYGHTEVTRPRRSNNMMLDLTPKRALPFQVARAIADQAMPNRRSVQRHRLLYGLYAHYLYKDHTQWEKFKGDIERAEAESRHLHTRRAPRG